MNVELIVEVAEMIDKRVGTGLPTGTKLLIVADVLDYVEKREQLAFDKGCEYVATQPGGIEERDTARR